VLKPLATCADVPVIACEACKCRALLHWLGDDLRGHYASAAWAGLFKCMACGSRTVALWLFAKRAEADGWIER
jgi:hypothetical protein